MSPGSHEHTFDPVPPLLRKRSQKFVLPFSENAPMCTSQAVSALGSVLTGARTSWGANQEQRGGGASTATQQDDTTDGEQGQRGTGERGGGRVGGWIRTPPTTLRRIIDQNAYPEDYQRSGRTVNPFSSGGLRRRRAWLQEVHAARRFVSENHKCEFVKSAGVIWSTAVALSRQPGRRIWHS